MLSAIIGRYTQLPENSYLVRQPDLKSEACVQYNLGAQYDHEGRFYKAELYYKDYSRLALVEENAGMDADAAAGTSLLTSGGYGRS